MNALNRVLDTLPRPRVGQYTQEVPTFRTCGIVGFYCAVIVAMGGGLLAQRSLVVISSLSLICALSFFVYAFVRRWITGHEELVLLEHVWFAEACAATFLWLLGEPVLGYLDVITPALCVFLAAGRVGCFLVGCCHGRPSSVGIAYDQRCADDGFDQYLVGVRLFPVQAIEAVGLLAIAVVGVVGWTAWMTGGVFVWFLISYAVMRFGLEELRGDTRPHLFGISQSQLMAIAEVVVALSIADNEAVRTRTRVVFWGLLSVVFIGSLIWRARGNPKRRILTPRHLTEVQRTIAALRGSLSPRTPALLTTSRGVAVAMSAGATPRDGPLHLSFSLPQIAAPDLVLLTELAERALPEAQLIPLRLTEHGVLHLIVLDETVGGRSQAPNGKRRVGRLYGEVVRQLQRGESTARHADDVHAQALAVATHAGERSRVSYFDGGATKRAP